MSAKQPKRKQPAPKSPKRKHGNKRKTPTPSAATAVGRLFQKGGPGGPGRPKGSNGMMREYIEGALQLQSIVVKMPNGKERIVSGKELLAFGMVDLALNGPVAQGVRQRSMNDVINRLEGLPVQAIKNLGDASGQVNITIARNLKDADTVEVKTERTEPAEPQNPK